ESKYARSPYFLKDRRPNEAADHGSEPVNRNIPRCYCKCRMILRRRISYRGRKVPDIRKCQIVCDGTANRNFRANINEDTDRAERQIGMLPDRVVDLLSDVMF